MSIGKRGYFTRANLLEPPEEHRILISSVPETCNNLYTTGAWSLSPELNRDQLSTNQ